MTQTVHAVGDLAPGGGFRLVGLPAPITEATVRIAGMSVQPIAGRYAIPPFVVPGAEIIISTTPAATRTLEIEAPASTTWLVLLVTQSNMLNIQSGAATADATTWPAGVSVVTTKGRILPAAAANDSGSGNAPLILAKHFAIDFLAARPGDQLVLVPAAVSSTGFAGGHWIDGGPLFRNAIAMLRAALLNNPTWRLRCVLVQGFEADAQASTPAATFRGQVDAFVSGLRRDLGSPNLPFIFGEMPDSFVAGLSARVAIRDEALAIPERVPYTAVASSRVPSVLPGIAAWDLTHFSTAACIEMGARHYAALAAADANTLSVF